MGHGKLLDFGANLDRVTLGQGPGRVRLESKIPGDVDMFQPLHGVRSAVTTFRHRPP